MPLSLDRTMMQNNLEIKLPFTDFSFAEQRIIALGASLLGSDKQTDNYYNTRKGTLKLRFSELEEAALIANLRNDGPGIRLASFVRIPVPDPAATNLLYEQMLGVCAVIKKQRKVFNYQDVRIHLDEVEGLGSFLEFECVLNPKRHDESVERFKLRHLMHMFEIKDEMLLAASYYQLWQKKYG
jgi:adenylate cyclase class 2